MVYVRRKKYVKRNKRYRRKRATNLPINTPLRKLLKAKMNYAELTSMSNAGFPYVNYVFSANGMWDPNISGTGHQYMGFDQIMAMYAHYTVIGSRIKVTFINKTGDGTADEPIFVGIGLSRIASDTWSSLEQFEEQTGTKMTLINSVQKDGNSRYLTANLNPAKYLGISKPMSEDTLKGTTSANPAESLYYHLFIASPSGTTPVATIKVEIQAHVIFSEPVKLIQS